VRDGKFILPIGRRLPLRDAAEAQVLAEKGGVGKIVLLAHDPQNQFLQYAGSPSGANTGSLAPLLAEHLETSGSTADLFN
jgi:hypothetical protein